uniref:Uncharacterized protein n=1 Tax=Opuntia streptacantha TaxID=393608 RepID=A0A7C8YK10_OPUST
MASLLRALSLAQSGASTTTRTASSLSAVTRRLRLGRERLRRSELAEIGFTTSTEEATLSDVKPPSSSPPSRFSRSGICLIRFPSRHSLSCRSRFLSLRISSSAAPSSPMIALTIVLLQRTSAALSDSRTGTSSRSQRLMIPSFVALLMRIKPLFLLLMLFFLRLCVLQGLSTVGILSFRGLETSCSLISEMVLSLICFQFMKLRRSHCLRVRMILTRLIL